MLSSYSISISNSKTGTLSDCEEEFAYTHLRFSFARSVVRVYTSFSFSSVRGAYDFVGDIRGSAVADVAAAAAIFTLRTRQTGTQSK